MFCIGSIRKAELTVGGRLVHKGIQKFPQVFFRCIIQRGQDADGGQAAVCRRFAGHFGPLGFQHLFGGQIAGTLAKAAALDKARAPFEHGGQALVLRQLHRIACQFSGTFQLYIHISLAALRCLVAAQTVAVSPFIFRWPWLSHATLLHIRSICSME